MSEEGKGKVYVGNLSWSTNGDTLRDAFSPYGQVTDVVVMQDRETGRSRGFGFVTFSSDDEAQAAINGLHEQDLDGRNIKVNMANARGSGGGSRGGYGGGGYQQRGSYGQQSSYNQDGYGQQGGYGGNY